MKLHTPFINLDPSDFSDFFSHISHNFFSFLSFSTKEKPPLVIRIGIITPAHHSLSARIIYGFVSMLHNLGIPKFMIKLHAVGTDTQTIRKNIENLLQQTNYDLIITLGARCSVVAYNVTLLSEKPPFIIFAGFRDPISLRLIDSFASSGNHMTGVTTGSRLFEQQITELLKLNIPLKNLLVIFNGENNFLNKDVSEIESACSMHNLSLEQFEINQHKNNYQKALIPLLKKADFALTLRDTTVLKKIKDIASLCKKHSVQLCTSEWYSIEDGASMGFGFDEKLIGEEVARKAFRILAKGAHPSQIPITTPKKSYELRVCTKNTELIQRNIV